MTVDDKHNCFSPVVIKLGAIRVAVDVVVDRFDIFVIFLCWDVHNKVRVKVISCRHTVLMLFAYRNGVEDSVKDFSVASEVSSGIGHMHTDPMSICDTQELGRRLHLYYVVVNYQRYGKFPSEQSEFSWRLFFA